ncbi:MAG: type VI secretion system-associated FHA domain protein [Polyangiales bacterium]
MRREDRDKERPYAPIQGPTSFAHEQRARGLGAVPELAPRERVVAPLHPSCVRSAEDWPRADESLDLPPLTAAEAAAGSAGRRFADPLAAAEWQLEQARAAWLLQVQRALDGAPAWSRAERIRALHANNPRLIEEAQFRHWAERCGVDPRELGHIELGTWLSRVCGVQSGPVPPSQWAPMLEQVGRVLELFSRAFVDAQRAQRRVREQLGLAATRRPEPANVLTRATESHAVIAYLLEPRRDPERRSHELQHQLADLAMHQVGILSGVLEGARALIHQLAPAQFSGGDSTRGAGNDAKLRETLNPFTAHKAWRRFSLRHQALLEPEQLGRELFGREFAQRYNVVTGNTPPSPAPQAVIHPPLIHPRPRSTPPPPPPRRKARTHI